MKKKTGNPAWDNTEYEKQIRIKVSDLNWIKENKVNASSAAFLNYIIKYYKENK